ncbi:MAG TPA: alanine dehydrogenase [Burkholderiales bacterium]|jgi:alanine dehydrogenase|nr:alanine dehydrogenase [Burkholderiales bacterium]
MIVGVPREIKDGEFRVGMTPEGVRELHARGHQVLIESGAGAGVGFSDTDYAAVGARIAAGPAEIYTTELVVKVKELYPAEFPLLHPGLTVFCFHHLAPDPAMMQALIDARIIAIAYETVGAGDGSLPILKPMSRIAGRLSLGIAMWALQTKNGGSGVLLTGVEGVAPGKVVILGAGASGSNAVEVAVGLGCDTVVFARGRQRLDELEARFPGRLRTRLSNPAAITEEISDADAVIGAVLTPGQTSPVLITRQMLRGMKRGSVLIDVGIDQKGIAETSRPSSHSDPLYVEEGVLHYCVPNMPAAVARSATLALAAASLPYVLALAEHGVKEAARRDVHLAEGIQLHLGQVTHAHLARDTGRPYTPLIQALA